MSSLSHRNVTAPGAVATLLVLASASSSALAELSPALDRFSFSAGVFNSKPTLSASVSSQFGSLDLGKLERHNVTMPRVTADFVFGDSQGLSLDYYQYSHDYVGPAANYYHFTSARVAAINDATVNLKLDFGKVAYKWWFGSGNTVFGLGAGAAYYRLAMDANATVAISGRFLLVAPISREYTQESVAPLLEFGVRHAITLDFRLFAEASGVKKTSGNTRGSIYSGALGVEWFPIRNVGLVASYSANNINLERGSDINDSVHIRLNGPSVFLKARF